MGRPTLGKIAMISTERSRRHRLKHRPEQPATKPGDDVTLATARERITELEAQVVNLAAAARRKARRAVNAALAAYATDVGRSDFSGLVVGGTGNAATGHRGKDRPTRRRGDR